MPPAAGGSVTVAPGSVVFTPAAGFFSAASFTYTVGDGTRTATATVVVTVGRPTGIGPVRPIGVGGATDGTVRLVTAAGGNTAVAPLGRTGTPTRTAVAERWRRRSTRSAATSPAVGTSPPATSTATARPSSW